MSTTFAELVSVSASLSSTSTLRLSARLSATLRASSSVGVNGIQTMGFVSGGVTYNALYAAVSSSATVTAPLGVVRAIQATLSSSSSLREGYGAAVTLPAIKGSSGDTAFASVTAVLPALTGSALDEEPIPSYVSAIAVLPALTGSAHMLSGTISTTTAVLSALASASGDTAYASASVNLPALSGLSNNALSAIGPTLQVVSGFVDEFTAALELGVSVSDGLESEDVFTLTRDVYADVPSALSMLFAGASTVEYNAVMDALVQFVAAFNKTDTQIVWVVNTDSGANWTYRNWDFNSFMAWQGKYYAAGPDGFYELAGDTDDGAPIVSSILTGNSDLGTVKQKRMAYVYVGAVADSGLSLIVHTDDGQTNEYEISARELLQNSRTSVGKGLRSRYWQFEITNPDGGDFELESLELAPDELIRRI